MTTRDTRRYSATQNDYADLDSFFEAPVMQGLSTISYNERVLDVLVNPSEGAETLILSFHPAVTNEKVTRPYFVGAGVFRTLQAHKVYFADPTLELNDELKLAWFAGNSEQRSVQDDLTRIIEHLVRGLGAKHVILVGTSGGGFAALHYSARIPNSLAFVVNPQTDLLKYHRQHVMKYSKLAWNIHTFEKAHQVLPQRTTTSVVGQYAAGPENSVLYLQSATDQHHIEHHMTPLLQERASLTDIRVLLGHGWGPGHHPAPKAMQIELLEAAVEVHGEWLRLWERFPEFKTPSETLGAVALTI
ncbi:alpha/beta fold hydrolase [Paeniglutamicibacter sp.]|uniref:alpha/beta fold hydrolase n=1 Tax=Paeniglutamicibacter sp. TaxID=1934391 RepID=UPI0039893E60